jgi:DNA polymerase I-like protein with 3'-5' exonuclease and polymerase domains
MMQDLLIGLDIETECAVDTCSDSECDHALIPHQARITVVGAYWEDSAGPHRVVFRDLQHLRVFLEETTSWRILAFNGKFDLKMLRYHGVNIPPSRWTEDPCLQAVASYVKVPDDYLTWYEAKRKELNKARKKGRAHREAGQHSLKVLAPYFLGIEPFWEPENHDDDQYVLLDTEYTYRLKAVLDGMLKEQGTYTFYKEKLMPWARMFLEAEERGVMLDMDLVHRGAADSERIAKEAKDQLDQLWAPAYAAQKLQAKAALADQYGAMETAAIAKLKTKTDERVKKTIEKYHALYTQAVEKIEPFNMGSPSQMKWLLRDYLGLNIHGYDGKESTDAEVLERLAAEGREDVKLLLKYREQTKLASTYYPAYKDMAHNGILHGSFNLASARTGRTSSSNPNLQNQPRALRQIFRARPGYKLLVKDLGAIEPTLIAYFSECPVLVDVLVSGKDFHGFNANVIFGQDWDLKTLKKEHPAERDMAKELGLSVLYGAGGTRVRIAATKRGYPWGDDKARGVAGSLRAAWPGVTDFKRQLDAAARAGKPITNMFGRKRVFTDPDDVAMHAFNSLIQSSGSDLLLDGTHRALQEFRAKGIDAHLLMTVHDELICEVPGDRAAECDEIVTRCLTDYKLETPHGLVPLTVEGGIADTWTK